MNPSSPSLTKPKSVKVFRIQKPWNIFHVREYSENTISALLSKQFNQIEILKITALPELVLPELARRKKQRLITLPFTLFFYPNFLRVKLLKLETRLFSAWSGLQSKNHHQKAPDDKSLNRSFLNYSTNDIIIVKNPENGTDLVVICQNAFY